MKLAPIIPIILFCISCSNKHSVAGEKETEKTISESKMKYDSIETKYAQNEVMREEDILFNGKLKRYFTLKEFENVFIVADSTKLMSEEEPCSYIFENEDGSKDMEDKYIYKDGSKFENTKDKLAVDEFRFIKNSFILFKGKKLDATTSISDLKELFPNAIQNIGILNVDGEGKLQVIQLREDENNISDGHLNMFIKNGKLYFMHWWFPC